MRSNEHTSVTLDCPSCDWQVVSCSAVIAGLSQAEHRITDHTTLLERVRAQRLVTSYQEVLGDLPGALLVLAVTQALDAPTQADTALEVVA